MTKLLAVIAATVLALTALLGSGSGARAGCDEDCQYEAQENAYERAYERDDERDDDEYERSGRRHFYQPVSRREQPTVRAEAKRPVRPVAVATPEPQPQPRTAREIAETENSSITTADDGAPEADTTGSQKKVAEAKDGGCKKFFASAGMTLSVPCE